MKLETLLVRSDNNRFARKADRDNTMVTEGHRHAGRKSKAEKLAKMDKELTEIRVDIENLELRMQQKAKPRWVYEWPMKEPKVKWPIKELMVRRQRRLLKGWLRYTENLNGPEEMVQVCEPETWRGLNDAESELGLVGDLTNCQEGREEIPVCQVGNELRSLRDLKDYHEDSQGISHCQLGNDMRSLRDLTDCQEGRERFPVCQVGKETEMELVDSMDCQEGSGDIPYCQVGRDDQMRLSEGLINSWMDLDQQVQLTEEEDLRDLLMIGGIQVFLPFAQEEAEFCIADAATVEEQSVVTVREEEKLEQTLEAAQADEEENEHSEECLIAFSQEAEEAVALKLTVEEAGEDNEHSEEWFNIFSQETERTATGEFAEEEEEEADNILLC
jgi:hypothetical protein